MDPEDADYVCTLDAATIKKAKEELNEDPNDRLAAVQALRKWIKEQPHITCPLLDTQTLLVFLRGSKFSQLKARQMVENNLRLKAIVPEWFLNIDTTEKAIQGVFGTGYILPLPKRTSEGCQIVMYRIAAVAPKQFTFAELIRAAIVSGAMLSKSEMSQVNGTVFILDFTGCTTAHATSMIDRKGIAKWSKIWTKNLPGRFKAFHYYNAGVFFEALMTVSRPFLPKKYTDRIKLHDTAESLYKYVDKELLPVEYLPDDYTGPSAGSVNDLIKEALKTISEKEFRDDLLYRSSDAFGVDESKKPDGEVNEHFRRLNID